MDIQNRFSVTFDVGTIPYSGTFPNVTLVRPFEANGDGFTDILLLTDNYGNTDQRSNAYLLTGRSDGGSIWRQSCRGATYRAISHSATLTAMTSRISSWPIPAPTCGLRRANAMS